MQLRLFDLEPPAPAEAERIFEQRFQRILEPAHDELFWAWVSRGDLRRVGVLGNAAFRVYVAHLALMGADPAHWHSAAAVAELARHGMTAGNVRHANREIEAVGLLVFTRRHGRPTHVARPDLSTTRVLTTRPPRAHSAQERTSRETSTSGGAPGCADCGQPVTRKPAAQGGGWNEWCKACWPVHRTATQRPPGLLTWSQLGEGPEPG